MMLQLSEHRDENSSLLHVDTELGFKFTGGLASNQSESLELVILTAMVSGQERRY